MESVSLCLYSDAYPCHPNINVETQIPLLGTIALYSAREILNARAKNIIIKIPENTLITGDPRKLGTSRYSLTGSHIMVNHGLYALVRAVCMTMLWQGYKLIK